MCVQPCETGLGGLECSGNGVCQCGNCLCNVPYTVNSNCNCSR